MLRDGAAGGSFETEIADDSAAAALFLATVDGALATGYLRVPGPEGRLDQEVHVAGYVYSPNEGAPPVGFGLFREVGPRDFELWLTGVAAETRGRGHGRVMMRELLATPPGRLVRCTRTGAHGEVALRLFRECGFVLCRTTASVMWLVSANASPDPPAHRGIAPCGLGATTGPRAGRMTVRLRAQAVCKPIPPGESQRLS